jgi:hypothetical protein
MPRTRKQSEVSVPEVLITRDQYIKDIKIRWQIHQYEITKLMEDLNKVVQTVAPYVQQIRARYVTVR